MSKSWRKITLRGGPYERGLQHGAELAAELAEVRRRFPFIVRAELKKSYSVYLRDVRCVIWPALRHFPDIMEELRGIAAGGVMTIEELVGWNSFMSMASYYLDGGSEKCCAFIATGTSTADGGIVMGHNSHSDFSSMQLYNIAMTIEPTEGGAPFKMQTSAGMVCSVTDWFLLDCGVIGCETTIAPMKYPPRFRGRTPYWCRIRRAMQYSRSIDDFIEIMRRGNAGDYSCAWLLGDTTTGEICRFELGVRTDAVARTFDGFFVGANGASDPVFAAAETKVPVPESIQARTVRLYELVGARPLTAARAKTILSDHFDVVRGRERAGANSVCKHVELDGEAEGRPFAPRGAYDGKVTTTSLARSGQFWGRMGAPCGRVFSIKNHIKRHPRFKSYRNYISAAKKQYWTIL